mmetsp:Transcript_129988/g.404333  ORF Transcript_129988/g.404333 Transcript_129988/m.404333 type:complete len:145 (+) Transcript_129988:580-1014(+)
MHLAEPMRSFAERIAKIRVRVCIGCHGGSTPKLIYVDSDNPAAEHLVRKLPHNAKWDRFVDITEYGNVSRLSTKKRCQTHPGRFREAVVDITKRCHPKHVMSKFGRAPFLWPACLSQNIREALWTLPLLHICKGDAREHHDCRG